MTPEEIEAETRRVVEEVADALQKAIPADMDQGKTLDRVAIIREFIGLSRTTAMAAAIYVSSYARIVGLDVADIHKMIDEVDAVMKSSPLTVLSQQQYAKGNAEYHKKQAEGGVAFEQLLLSPDSGKVH